MTTTQTATQPQRLEDKKAVKAFLSEKNFPESVFTIKQKTLSGSKIFTVVLPRIEGHYKSETSYGLTAGSFKSPTVFSSIGKTPANHQDIARLNAAQRVIELAANLYLSTEGVGS